MKRPALFLLGILVPVIGLAMSLLPPSAVQAGIARHPVQWNYRVEKLGERLYALHLKAVILPGWHLYAQQQPEDAIAFPTAVRFRNNPEIVFSGGLKEQGRLEKYQEPVIGISAWQYEGEVDFVQVVRLKKTVPVDISGSISFQACTEEECLPPVTTAFNIIIKE